jgi:hypothetical protein
MYLFMYSFKKNIFINAPFFEIIQIRTSFMPCLISEGNMGWSENKVPSIPAGLSSLFPIIPIKIAI